MIRASVRLSCGRGPTRNHDGFQRLAGSLDFCTRRVNHFYVRVVMKCMKRGTALGKLGLGMLIALTVFVSAVRPIAHPTGRLFPRFGLTRMSLLSEPPDIDSTAVPAPVVADAQVVELPLVISLLLLVLRTRRAAFLPFLFRRLKLPARSAERSLPSD